MRRLLSVEVDDLLGRFDHSIELPSEWEFVIVHGPNGVGKTRLLEIIADTFRFRTHRLSQQPFAQARFRFDDGYTLDVTRASQGTLPIDDAPDAPEQTPVSFVLRGSGEDFVEWVSTSRAAEQIPRSAIRDMERYLPIEQVGPDTWMDRRTGEYMSLAHVAERFGEDLPFDIFDTESPPPELAEFVSGFDVHLIETQRLLGLDDFRPGPRTGPRQRDRRAPTVMQFASDLARRIREALARNSRVSQELDRTFPRRVLEQELMPSISDDEIRERYLTQSDLRQRLAEISVLSASDQMGIPLPEKELEPWERRVLWTYLEDSEQKLSTFVDLLDRVDLLREILNSRYLFVEVLIDAEKGFRFLNRETGNDVQPLSLSSGEQHELILLYDLLFNVDPNSLVLVDEPEISLHVAWQQEFLNDIQRIANLADLRFLVATHSPQIIHSWWDRARALYVPPENRQ